MKPILNLFFLLFSIGAGSQNFTESALSLGLSYGYSSGEYGGGVSFADFNQDGLDDLTFSTGSGQQIRFHQNTGSGFVEIEPLVNNSTEVKQVLWVDYDNDGDLDLYVTSHTQNKLYKNTGNLEFTDITATCGFSDPANVQSFCGSWLDYDEDGLPDLCVSFRIAHLVGKITLYHNLGDDQFEDVTAEAGLSNKGNSVLAMATLDVDNDGWEDIYAGQDYQAGCLLLRNNGNGTFSDISFSSNTAVQNNSMTVTIGDYNTDGWMDIYLTDTGMGNSLLENQGDQVFYDVAQAEGVLMNMFTWGAVFLDADNDMDLDLHVNGTYSCTMYENQGSDDPFVNVSAAWGFDGAYNYGVGLAMGDYNNDGRVDFAKNCSYSTLNKFWQNDFTTNNYLTIDLHGTVSNSMAIGAVIDVVADGIHQFRRVGCGESFSSQHSYSQFFGLGENLVADSVIVKWPNGLVSILTDVATNQRISITENGSDMGCMDATACNYQPEATEDDGSCYYPEPYYSCDGSCLNDMDLDGVCDELEVIGCMDATACNYQPEATEDNGSCYYPDPYYNCDGTCMYDMDSDGVCDELEITGCQESGACNYNPDATDNDFNCLYPDPGWTCNGDCLMDSDGDGICDQFEMYGCTDPSACNYESWATEESGSCMYAAMYYTCWGSCVNDWDMDGVCDELEVQGCTDPSACNFDPFATENIGCQYVTAYLISGSDTPDTDSEEVYSYPESSGSYYMWEVTNGTIMSGQGTSTVQVLWTEEGMGSISVTETAGNCLGQPVVMNVVVTASSIFESPESILILYPNPASTTLTISLSNVSASTRLKITDAQGRMVASFPVTQPVVYIDANGFANGIYQVSLIGSDVITKHFIVAH